MDTLQKLAQQRDRRANLMAQVEAIDTEIRHLVRTGIAEGLTGPQMAEATGLSTQRISQIKRGGRR